MFYLFHKIVDKHTDWLYLDKQMASDPTVYNHYVLQVTAIAYRPKICQCLQIGTPQHLIYQRDNHLTKK